ncbi:MAG: permease-like cell division protein FtsX [Oscillospiraceae bacterium]|nr:permease-like cell division protein FtsX [Oscillospiraceae bacterium]
MRFNIMGYFLNEGFKNVFKNKKSTFACLGVMCAAMLMFGLFYAIGENITNVIRQLEDTEVMQVFLANEVTEEERDRAREEILRIEGVNDVRFVSSADALDQMRSRLEDRRTLVRWL